jgi:oxaloacetate decarboxylase alpha subunit
VENVVTQATGVKIEAPMAGTILKINVGIGSQIIEGDVVVIMETMKMETEVRSRFSGVVSAINTREGTMARVGEPLIIL